MTDRSKYNIFTVLAVACCVLPPLITTLCQFPVWVESPKMVVSGICVLFIFFSCLPFIRQIKEFFKSPSATVLWIIVFAALMVLKSIINQMLYVTAAGLIGNCIGEIFFSIRKRYKEDDRYDEPREEKNEKRGRLGGVLRHFGGRDKEVR